MKKTVKKYFMAYYCNNNMHKYGQNASLEQNLNLTLVVVCI